MKHEPRQTKIMKNDHTSTNDECRECGHGRWTINGRYCGHAREYVEYAKTPPCQQSI